MALFEKSKENIFEVCKTWQKSDLNKGISRYYDNFEGYSKEHIKNDIQEYQKAIADLKQRSEAIKKEKPAKGKDKEKATIKDKKATLEEVKNHLEDAVRQLKEKQKELDTLPQRIKGLKADFQEKMKGLNKAVEEISLLKMQGSKEGVATNQKIQEFLLKLADINKIVSIDEIIKNSGMEFKLENETGSKVIKDYRKLVVMLHESIGARWHDMAIKEKLGARKVEYLKNMCTELAFAANAARVDGWEVDYYSELLVLGLARLTITLGIQQVEAYEYWKATQYFLKAREILLGIKKALKIEKLLAEQVALARAYASDTFNIIYLLNSHVNWKAVAKNTDDEELKDVASISIKNIEEWITKQYGFPPDDKINSILGGLIWPSPQAPPEVADFLLLQPSRAAESRSPSVTEGKPSTSVDVKQAELKASKAESTPVDAKVGKTDNKLVDVKSSKADSKLAATPSAKPDQGSKGKGKDKSKGK